MFRLIMKGSFVSCALGTALLVGCATSPKPLPLITQRVGPPRPELIIRKNEGMLIVYSGWENPTIGLEESPRQHSDYKIIREDGSLFKRVRNARFTLFGDPAEVSLAPGNYTVEVLDPVYTSVLIPVSIAENRTTIVCVTDELDSYLEALQLPSDALVRLPDGRIVGWSVAR